MKKENNIVKRFEKFQINEPWQDPRIDPYIRINNVSFGTSNAELIKGIDLSIYKGEFFSILGESGCGKTTLLRLIAGFVKPSSGEIYIDDIDVTNIPPYERPVNMMFQSYALFPHMTVRENIAFGLKQDKYHRNDVDERVENMLKLTRLEKYAHKNPEDLSGGQKQRVALARCIAKRPKVICLDEPLGALDKSLRDDMQFELVRIQEEVGITFIMVTHDQEEAMTVSSRIAIMENGIMRQIGTPSEVYEYPNSRYIGDFIGLINFFEGVVIDVQKDHVIVQSAEIASDLCVSCSYVAPIGSNVIVGVRPEKIKLSQCDKVSKDDGSVKNINTASGTVVDIGYLGDVSVYHIMLDDSEKIVFATQHNYFRIAERPVTWEDKVILKWEARNSLVLTH